MKSRLFKQFGLAQSDQMFLFESLTDDYDDSQILSCTITRGSTSFMPRFTPSTIEIELAGAPNIRRTAWVYMSVNPYVFDAFIGKYASPQNHHRRFAGTKTLSTVNDRQWSHTGTPARWTTTVTGVSWTARIASYSKKYIAKPGQITASYLATHLRQRPIETGVDTSNLDRFDSIYGPEEALDFSEAIRKYADDLGTLISHQRGGQVRIESIQSRALKLEQMAKYSYAIQRDQCLSPAKWSTTAEMATTKLHVKRRLSNGGIYEQDWPVGTFANEDALRSEEVDLTYITDRTESFRNIVNAKNYNINWSQLSVDEITVDMGLLFQRGRDIDREVFKRLLIMEEGDPVYLSTDWPQAVRGSYFSTQIQERISPDGWTFTIGLARAHYVIGVPPSQIPELKPKTWDQINAPWDSPPYATWHEY